MISNNNAQRYATLYSRHSTNNPAEGTPRRLSHTLPSNESFLLDESRLSQRLGIRIADPIRVFDLSLLGLGAGTFLERMRPSFAELEWDGYDQKLYGLTPYRRRAIASFMAEMTRDNGWRIARQPSSIFRMNVADRRSSGRTFHEMSDAVIRDADFQKLLGGIAQMTRCVRPDVRRLKITAHQISIVARSDAPASNSPEGIHQDGADFIVSALVVARKNIGGGVSNIYGPDRATRYLSVMLKPGQGIFQADAGSQLWHDVTPIKVAQSLNVSTGVRNIFGFDIVVER